MKLMHNKENHEFQLKKEIFGISNDIKPPLDSGWSQTSKFCLI